LPIGNGHADMPLYWLPIPAMASFDVTFALSPLNRRTARQDKSMGR
jgi:hypothetical protein